MHHHHTHLQACTHHHSPATRPCRLLLPLLLKLLRLLPAWACWAELCCCCVRC
jgi:hypothetical protein